MRYLMFIMICISSVHYQLLIVLNISTKCFIGDICEESKLHLLSCFKDSHVFIVDANENFTKKLHNVLSYVSVVVLEWIF